MPRRVAPAARAGRFGRGFGRVVQARGGGATAAARAMTGDALDLTGYRLTFDDEFDAFSWNGGGNTGTWSTTYSYGERKLNDERQLYTDATLGIVPFSVGGGALHITAAPTTDPAKTWGQPYSSGVITTYKSFAQQHGVFEMRAKLPEGQGLWPAFWLLAVKHVWPPELDVLEGFGNRTDQMHWGALTGTSLGNKGNWVQVPADVTDGYHSYAVRWTAETLTYYFDGVAVAQTPTPSDMRQPMYMIANLAVGGHWAGDPTPDTRLPARLSIDYIRAYSADPAVPAVAPRPVSDPDAGRVETAAMPHTERPRLSETPTNKIDRDGTVGTEGNDRFQTFYGDTATRTGGGGDDTYIVTDPRMFLAEAAGGGTDTVEAWVDYTLPSGVENIVIAGTWAMRVTGNALPNRIAGNAGADTLAGRGGDDVLSGGRGADRFIVRAGEGHDTITDFQAGSDAGHDTVLLSGYSYATTAEVLAALRADGADTVLDFRNGETLTFEGVAKEAFAAEDFLLASVTAAPAFAAVPAPPPPRVLAPVTVGSGQDRIVLRMSGDAYQGSPQFTVSVDGKRVGGTQTVQAARVSGEVQDFVVQGTWGGGEHGVTVDFVNDKWAGTALTDRNLYVEAVSYNGLDAGHWAALTRGGARSFRIAAPAAPGAPGADPTPAPVPVPALDPVPAPGPDPVAVPAPAPGDAAPRAPGGAGAGGPLLGPGAVAFGFGARGVEVARTGADEVAVRRGGAVQAVHAATELRFLDGRLVFDPDDPAAAVARLYRAGLGRDVDQVGLDYWTRVLQGGARASDLARGFLASPEAQALYGADSSDAEFVARLYRNVLGREGDAGGQAFWTGRLGEGASRADVLAAMADGAENRAATAAAESGGLWDLDEGAAGVARLYDAVLGRLPDAGGLGHWAAALDRGETTLRGMAEGFMASPEYQALYGALTDAEFVRALYRNTLDRPGDTAGVDHWTSLLGAGLSRAALVVSFSESPEHVALTAPDVMDGVGIRLA